MEPNIDLKIIDNKKELKIFSVSGSWAAPVHNHGLGDQWAENQARHRHLSGEYL